MQSINFLSLLLPSLFLVVSPAGVVGQGSGQQGVAFTNVDKNVAQLTAKEIQAGSAGSTEPSCQNDPVRALDISAYYSSVSSDWSCFPGCVFADLG